MDRHPHIVEADKRLQAAKDQYVHAVDAIVAQYLKPLMGQGDETVLVEAQRIVDSSQGVDELAHRYPPMVALVQPPTPEE